MIPERIRVGLQSGLLAAAATAGALVGLGIRHESAMEPFLATGRSLLTTPSGLVPLAWLALMGGLLVHVVSVIAWSTLFALITRNLRRRWLAVAALTFVAALGLLVPSWSPHALGVLGRDELTSPQRALILGVMALALFAGVRRVPVSRT